jgi:uncharacterized membrane protein
VTVPAGAPDPLDGPARAARLRALRDVLPDEIWRRAWATVGAPPPVSAWREALSLGLALLGGALIGAAIIYAVAFNWQAMGREVRLMLPIVLTAGLALGGRALGFDRLGGLVCLSLACLTAGAALLVHGQTYQTGADAWQLFASWAVLITPWVVLSRFAPLVVAWILLLNLAFGTFWETQFIFFGPRVREVVGAVMIGGANAGLLALWEHSGERHLRAGAGRFGPRTLMLLSASPLTGAACWSVLETRSFGVLATLSIGALGAAVAVAHAYYRPGRRPDLFALTVAVFAVVSVLITGGSRVIFDVIDLGEGGILFVSAYVLALVAWAASWLRTQHREISGGSAAPTTGGPGGGAP